MEMHLMLNHPILVLLLTAIISFLGSVQPGLVNVMASRFALSHGKVYAQKYSLASCIPEFLYAFLVGFYISKIDVNQQQRLIITIIAGFVLVLFGLYIFFNPPKVEVKGKSGNPFIIGFAASLTNPQLLIFWSGIVIFYKQYGINIQDNLPNIISFAVGAAVGAYLLLVTYMKLSETFLKELNDKKLNLLNKISGIVLILIGLFAFLSLFEI